MTISHFHLVRKPGEREEQMACHIPDNQCRLGEGTPEEIGEYVVSDAYHKMSFLEYRRRKAFIEQTKKSSNTVPVVRYENDKRIVVGTAEVEIVDGEVRAVFVINSSAISKRFGTIGPFSIGERSIQVEAMNRLRDAYTRKSEEIADKLLGPLEAELLSEDDQDVCTDPACTYYEPHKHGFACTSTCNCNRHGRVD